MEVELEPAQFFAIHFHFRTMCIVTLINFFQNQGFRNANSNLRALG
jgi:hypothetical protein